MKMFLSEYAAQLFSRNPNSVKNDLGLAVRCVTIGSASPSAPL